MYAYLLLISFSMDLLSSINNLTRRTFTLKLRAPSKYPLYILKRFYSFNKANSALQLMTALILLNFKNIPYILYALLLPFILYKTHPIFTFLPFIFKMPLVIILIFVYNMTNMKLPPLNFKLPSTLLLLPTLFMAPIHQGLSETSLILFSFISSVSLDNSLNASTLELKSHRNRYFISLLNLKKVTLTTFSSQIQSSLRNMASTLFILLLIYGGLTHHMLSILIILLSTLMFIYFVFDKLFQFTFLSNSSFYTSKMRRALVSYLPIFIMSCFLSYRLFHTYLDITPTSIEIAYILLLLVVVLTLKKRNLIVLIPLLLVTGCTSKTPEGFVVTHNTPMFYASMQSKETQTLALNPSSIIKVENGAMIEKNTLLVIDNSLEYNQELERLNYQLKNTKATKLLDTVSKREKISELEFEIKLLNERVNQKAKIDGMVSINNDTLSILSTDLHIALEITESEYPLIKDINTFQVMNLNKEVLAIAILEKTIPNHTSQGTTYTLIFKDFKHDCYPYQSLIITPNDPIFIVPDTYVKTEGEESYVKDATHEHAVEILTESLNMIFITKGITEGMVLLPYE